MAIKTEPAQHSEELLTAIEKTLKSHNLRLVPGQSLHDVAEAFKANQVELSESNGYLNATMHNQPVHLNTVVESLATKEAARFFPRDPSNVTSRDSLDRQGKIKFIAEQGIDAWEKLPQSASADTVTVLDQRRLTAAQYLALPRKTRADLSGQWGASVIGQILSRK
jgi:hypothetical protein